MKKLSFFVCVLATGLFQNIARVSAATALTADQTTQVQTFLKSQANWNNLLSNELQKSAGTQVLAPAVGTTQGINQQTIDGNCNVKVVPPSQKGILTVGSAADNNQTQVPMFTVTIDGPACPVQLAASIDGEQNANGFKGGFVFNVKVNDPTFAKQYDVDTVSMQMDMSAILTQAPGSATSDVKVDLSLKGQAHSLTLGNVNEAVSMGTTLDVTQPSAGQFIPGIKMKLSETLSYQFSGFSADLESTIDLEGILGPVTSTYLVNGVSVSQQDYQAFLNSISLPLSQNPTSTTPPQASNAMSCEVRIYDAKQVSKQTLLDSISKHTPVVAKALLDDSKTESSQWVINALQAEIDFESQYVTLTLKEPSTGQSNELTVLTGEDGDVADQLGNYTFRLTCTAVAQ